MDDSRKVEEVDQLTGRADGTQAAAKLTTLANRRIQRIHDLLESALEESDVVRSNVRAAAAELLEVGHRLAVGIKSMMDAEPMSSKRSASVLMPAIDRMAVVHRQATRYVQLDQERATSNDLGKAGKIR